MGLALNLTGLTRGALGLTVPSLLTASSNRYYYFVALGMMLTTYVLLRLITTSHIGLAFRALGQNQEAARASGVRPTRYRVLNFTVSCAFGGWLGGFYAYYYGILTPDVMSTSHTVAILAIAYIGGRGSLWGGAVIAFPMTYLTRWLSVNLTSLPGLDLVIYGVLLILVMIYYPAGLAGVVRQLRDWVVKLLLRTPQPTEQSRADSSLA
jgi:branched-chain amino acid transport system permease protein